jgi:hypothetical protein
MDMCGAAREAVAIHREQAATKHIHLPPKGKKGRFNLMKYSGRNVLGIFKTNYV